jgi:hypothetical protein
MENMEKKFIRKADFLEIVPISESSLNRLIKRKVPPFDRVVKISRIILIPTSIITYFEQNQGEVDGQIG